MIVKKVICDNLKYFINRTIVNQIIMILLIFLLVGFCSPTNIPSELRGCDHLRYAYSSRGVPEYEVPGSPLQGN